MKLSLDFSALLHAFRTKEKREEYLKLSEVFQTESKSLAKALSSSEAVFKTIPLLSAFLAWTKEDLTDSERLADAKALLENGFIGLKDAEGAIWTLKHTSKQDPNVIFEAIRCKRDWPLTQREQLVKEYKAFLSFLSVRTNRYITLRTDEERDEVRSREIGYDEFLTFADQLNDKSQLVAKLLYFGGNRTLEEVLALAIPDVNFEPQEINFGSQAVSYPLQVFVDIKASIGKRSKGRVFLGRQNAPLNPATIFRNFKDAAEKTGLHFGVGLFTQNKDLYHYL